MGIRGYGLSEMDTAKVKKGNARVCDVKARIGYTVLIRTVNAK